MFEYTDTKDRRGEAAAVASRRDPPGATVGSARLIRAPQPNNTP